MKKFAVLFVLLGAASLSGAEVSHRFIANGFSNGEATVIAADGSTEWKMGGLRWLQDSWVLDNGNYLFSYKTGVKEVSPDKQVVWEYKSPKNVELHSVQPLKNGNFLACECGTKRLIEIDRTGAVVKEIAMASSQKRHMQFRMARQTVRGTYLVANLGESSIKELDEQGAVLRTLKVGDGRNQAHGVQELENGNWLVSTAHGHEIKEFDPQGNLVWQLSEQDLLDAGVVKVGYTAGVQRLANGNTILCIYHGDPQVIEMTPDKKMVWSFNQPELGAVVNVTLLD